MDSKYQSVVVALDASEDCDQILNSVQNTFADKMKRCQFVSVVPPIATASLGMEGGLLAGNWPLKDMEEQLEQTSRERIEQYLSSHGFYSDSLHIRFGKASAEIRLFAEGADADLIIIGSHARTGVKRLMLGSTANAVLHGAPCDVLVIRIDE